VTRPKLLFLSHNLPFPPDEGAKARTYHVLRLLARDFDVTAVCFIRDGRVGTPAVSRRRDVLGAVARVEVFEIPQVHSRRRLIRDHLKSVATRRVYTGPMYESSDAANCIQQLVRTGGFDMVHVDSLDLSAYLGMVSSLPIACTHHNVESELLRQRAASMESAAARSYGRYQAHLMQREEDRWCPRVGLNVFVSDRDRQMVRQRMPTVRSTVVPNGVDVEYFRPLPTDESALAFVGGTAWYPNRDALDFFATEIKPQLDALGCNPRVKWIGRSSDEERSRYASAGVELTGYVPDIRDAVGSAACFIVPLRVGGGTRLKILDAWAMGKPVVSTSIGCSGLDARDGQNIIIRDDPADFATAIQSVLADAGLRRRLSVAARQTAESTYSWSVIGAHLKQEYFKLIAGRAGPEPDAMAKSS
jgi:glycosyltransferase involved in cell wall biosynthesis